jgi:hypothetical protein
MTAMAKNEEDTPVLSDVEARAGVTGHHVRHVLAFGLAGAIIAYLVVALYFYYRELSQTLSHVGQIKLNAAVSYAIPLALAGVAGVLVLGLWNMVARRKPETSQTLMRWRIALQFIALCLVMAAFYLSAKS